MDKEKFLKIMALTMSDNEHEAANALKHAIQMLKKHKLTWVDVISITVKTPPQSPRDQYRQRSQWDDIFSGGFAQEYYKRQEETARQRADRQRAEFEKMKRQNEANAEFQRQQQKMEEMLKKMHQKEDVYKWVNDQLKKKK